MSLRIIRVLSLLSNLAFLVLPPIAQAAAVSVASGSVSPTTVAPGSTASINVGLKSDFNNSNLRVHLQVRKEGTTTDLGIQVFVNQVFQTNVVKNFNYPFAVPSNLAAGNYCVLAAAWASTFDPLYLWNDCAARFTVAASAPPTVVVTGVSPTGASVAPGAAINLGTGLQTNFSSPDLHVKFELRREGSQTLLAEYVLDNQAFTANQSKTVNWNYTVPSSFAPGTYCVGTAAFSANWATTYLWEGCANKFTVTTSTPPGSTMPGFFKYGVAMASMQGVPDTLPGRLYSEVWITDESHYAYYAPRGFTHVRLDSTWERLQPRLYGALGEKLYDAYPAEMNSPLRNPVAMVRYHLDLAQKYGYKVVLDLAHNYGRRYIGYDGDWDSKRQVLLGTPDLPVDAFLDYTVKIVQEFGSHPAVAAIELMNEPHGLAMGPDGWRDACQRAINAIRQVNSSIWIVVDGYEWASANAWSYNNPTLHTLSDPSNRIIFSGHQYFDDDSSGTYRANGQEQNPTHNNLNIGVERIQNFADWLAAHNLQGRGMLGEFGAPNSPKWSEIVRRTMLAASQKGIMLAGHQDVSTPNDSYPMNLYPRTGEGDRYLVLLMESLAKGTNYIQAPLY